MSTNELPASAASTETVAERVEKLREYVHAMYNGGHNEEPEYSAFHHGMDTACNQLGRGGWLDAAITEATAQLREKLATAEDRVKELEVENAAFIRKALSTPPALAAKGSIH